MTAKVTDNDREWLPKWLTMTARIAEQLLNAKKIHDALIKEITENTPLLLQEFPVKIYTELFDSSESFFLPSESFFTTSELFFASSESFYGVPESFFRVSESFIAEAIEADINWS